MTGGQMHAEVAGALGAVRTVLGPSEAAETLRHPHRTLETREEGPMRRFRVTVDGKAYEVTVEEIPAAKPDRNPSPPAPQPRASQGRPVKAPMPGTVLEVRVAPGDAVTAQSVLLVLEAMKMENDILAPAGGTISAVRVTAGDSVNSGDVLAIIE